MKLLIHSQTSTAVLPKFGNVNVISYHTLLGLWLLIHAGIKVVKQMKASIEFELCLTESELDGPGRVYGSLCDVGHDNDLSHKGYKWGENLSRKLESSDNF